MKRAILSLDVEDWYHLDYLKNNYSKVEYSMLDGLNNYMLLLDDLNIKSSFFVLSDIIGKVKDELSYLVKNGHDIGSHGMSHLRPIKQTISDFKKDVIKSKEIIEHSIMTEIIGYRAPCFSIDDQRYDKLMESGYFYSSSKIDFNQHPLYGSLSMADFDCIFKSVYKKNNFFEFEISTYRFLNKNIPVSGGGYIRIFPWYLMKKMIESYLKINDLYILYIHPFELSLKEFPKIETSFFNNLRFKVGKMSVMKKMEELILLLKKNDFKFTTFKDYRLELLELNGKNTSNL